MVAWMCALGALCALSFWLVSELPDVAEKGIADRLLDGFWFAFIALTTIGLGDFVPPAREWHVFLVHFLFLLVGVTLVGLLISAAVRSHADQRRRAKRKQQMEEHPRKYGTGEVEVGVEGAEEAKEEDAANIVPGPKLDQELERCCET